MVKLFAFAVFGTAELLTVLATTMARSLQNEVCVKFAFAKVDVEFGGADQAPCRTNGLLQRS